MKINVIGSEIVGSLSEKIKGGRLSEFLERVPYIDESVQGVSYEEIIHSAVIVLKSASPISVELVSKGLQDLEEALLGSKILPQKTIRNHKRDDGYDYTPSAHTESQGYYDENDIFLLEKIDQLITNIAVQHGATLRDYGSVYAANIMERCNYHKNFPQNVYAVSHIPHNYATIKEIREDTSPRIDPRHFVHDGAYLQPCVCYHCYDELTELKPGPTVMTMKGRCFRHEIQWKLNSFRRNEFVMREIVFIGPDDFVESKRINIMDQIWDVFCEIGLYGQVVTARDPFFHYDDMKTKGAVQLMADAKYELEYQSHSGKTSSIASFNNCQDTLCEKFSIRDSETDKFLHSGCVAFGIDRWRSAIIEEFGNNPKDWPTKLLNP